MITAKDDSVDGGDSFGIGVLVGTTASGGVGGGASGSVGSSVGGGGGGHVMGTGLDV